MNLPRIPNLLALGVITLVLTALGFQAWTVLEGRERALAQATLRAANRAQATAHQVESVFKATDLVLLDLTHHLDAAEVQAGPDPATARKAPALRRLLLEHAAEVPLVLFLHVVGADGRYVYSSHDGVPPFSLADRAYFQEQQQHASGRLVVSEPYLGKVSQRWGIYLSRRLQTPDGRFAGIVIAVLDAETLASVMQAVDQQQWILALYHQNRQLVARAPGLPGQTGLVRPESRPLPGNGYEPATFAGPGFGADDEHLWAAQPLSGAPMFTLAGYAQAQALAQWRKDLWLHLAVAGLLVSGCLGVLGLHRRNLAAGQALTSREAYFRTLFDASPEAIAVIEGEAAVDANIRYRELFRSAPGDRTPPWERVAAGPAGEAVAGQLAAAGEGRPATFSARCLRTDGTGFEAEFSITRFRHGERPLRIAIVRDLTRIRELEARLLQAQKLDALGRLAGGVAHDFNNMLAAIHASAEVLAERSTDPNLRRISTVILSAAERSAQLTRQLLAFARQGKILSIPTDLHQLLGDSATLLERTLDRRIRLVIQRDAERSMVIGDPSQLENVFINLAVNARDAMPEGGELSFRTGTLTLAGEHCQLGPFRVDPGEYLLITVRDTGSGIAPDHLQRIFDPFFTTKAAGKGTGLGLASVFGTMATHRGAVTVDSPAAGGTVFSLYLPLAAEQTPGEPRVPPELTPGSGAVLVIDDEELVRSSTVLQLQALGYQPWAEGDPAAAVDYFRRHHGELAAVLLDMVMPKASGSEVAAELRKIDPGVPVVIASGFPRNAKVEDLLAQGLAGYLQKPYGRRELGELLNRICRGR